LFFSLVDLWSHFFFLRSPQYSPTCRGLPCVNPPTAFFLSVFLSYVPRQLDSILYPLTGRRPYFPHWCPEAGSRSRVHTTSTWFENRLFYSDLFLCSFFIFAPMARPFYICGNSLVFGAAHPSDPTLNGQFFSPFYPHIRFLPLFVYLKALVAMEVLSDFLLPFSRKFSVFVLPSPAEWTVPVSQTGVVPP